MNKDIKSHYLLGAIGACVLLAVGAAYLLAPHALKTRIEEDTVVLGTEKDSDAAKSKAEAPLIPDAPNTPVKSAPKDRLCADVITRAKDPKTQTVHEFPTPCDVPVGWHIMSSK